MSSRPKLSALCDATIGALGGIEAYSKLLARDLRKAMDMSQQPLASAREMRISLQAHNIAINLNKEADKGNRDDARLALEADEARDLIMAEIKQQIIENPALRNHLLQFIHEHDEDVAPKTQVIEVLPEPPN